MFERLQLQQQPLPQKRSRHDREYDLGRLTKVRNPLRHQPVGGRWCTYTSSAFASLISLCVGVYIHLKSLCLSSFSLCWCTYTSSAFVFSRLCLCPAETQATATRMQSLYVSILLCFQRVCLRLSLPLFVSISQYAFLLFCLSCLYYMAVRSLLPEYIIINKTCCTASVPVPLYNK